MLAVGRVGGFVRRFGFVAGATHRLWRSFWFSGGDMFRVESGVSVGAAGGSNAPTAPQQGAASDRLQLRSLWSFLPSLSALPAAGELNRWAVARG